MFSVVPLKGQTPQIGLICELERMILPKITYKAARPLYVPCKMDGAHNIWVTLEIQIQFFRQSRHTNTGYL